MCFSFVPAMISLPSSIICVHWPFCLAMERISLSCVLIIMQRERLGVVLFTESYKHISFLISSQSHSKAQQKKIHAG